MLVLAVLVHMLKYAQMGQPPPAPNRHKPETALLDS